MTPGAERLGGLAGPLRVWVTVALLAGVASILLAVSHVCLGVVAVAMYGPDLGGLLAFLGVVFGGAVAMTRGAWLVRRGLRPGSPTVRRGLVVATLGSLLAGLPALLFLADLPSILARGGGIGVGTGKGESWPIYFTPLPTGIWALVLLVRHREALREA